MRPSTIPDYPILTPDEWYDLTEEIKRLNQRYGWKNTSEALQYDVRKSQLARNQPLDK